MSALGSAVTISAAAKTNLALHVGQPREDGYHPLETLFLALDLRDSVTARMSPDSLRQKGGITVSVAAATGTEFQAMVESGLVSLKDIPVDDSNLAVRAAQAVCDEYGLNPGLELHISKAIPVAGGMGGGSADAAAALVAVNQVLAQLRGEQELPLETLARLAAGLGADVPFMLHGGLAVGRDSGIDLEPLETSGQLHLVVVPQVRGLSTPAVFRRWDQSQGIADCRLDRSAEHHPGSAKTRTTTTKHGPKTVEATVAATGAPSEIGCNCSNEPDPLPRELLSAAAAGDAMSLAPLIRNDLQAPAIELFPELAQLLDTGAQRGALAGWVSGSGPTVCFLASDARHAAELAQELRADHHHAIAVCGPVPGTRVE